jgi:type I restriction enzyme S subunit
LDTIEGSDQAYACADGAVVADPEDVVMVADGARSGVAFNGLRGAVGSTLTRLRPIDAAVLSPFELMLFLDEHEADLRSRNVGAAIPHMNKEYLLRLPVTMVTGHARGAFLALTEDIFRLLWNLRDQSRVAAGARDLLLPRLVSGEIDVDDLDISVGEAAA